MIIFIPIGFFFILALIGVATGFYLFQNISYIIWGFTLVLGCFFAIIESFRLFVLDYPDKRPSLIINLLYGFHTPYFIFSLMILIFDNAEKINFVSSVLTIVFLISFYSIEKHLFMNKKRMLWYIYVVFMIMIACTASIYGYNKWKNDILSEYSYKENDSYVMDSDCFPIVREYKSSKKLNKGVSARFPFWTSYSRYPFVKFKKGETVHKIGDSNYFYYIKNGKRRYQQCYLLCNSDQSVIGYVPKNYIVGLVEELNPVLETVQKDAIGKSFVDTEKPAGIVGTRVNGVRVKFIDNDTVKFIRGEFECTLKGFKIVEKYDTQEYKYKFEKTLFGKIYLVTEGTENSPNIKYRVKIDKEYNTIKSIEIY